MTRPLSSVPADRRASGGAVRTVRVLCLVFAVLLAAFGVWAVLHASAIRKEQASEQQNFTDMAEQRTQLLARTPQVQATPAEAAQQPEPAEPAVMSCYEQMVEENPDFYGWICIPGTLIDYPVMHSPDDPERYLYRDYTRQESYCGTPFLDAQCPTDGSYALIYGHHMKNLTMFGVLPQYADASFRNEHMTIEFDTRYEQRDYEVIAAFYTYVDLEGKEDFHYYEYRDLSDEVTFNNFMAGVRGLSLFDTGRPVTYGDELLVLSTCNYHTENGRFVVVAVRVG